MKTIIMLILMVLISSSLCSIELFCKIIGLNSTMIEDYATVYVVDTNGHMKAVLFPYNPFASEEDSLLAEKLQLESVVFDSEVELSITPVPRSKKFHSTLNDLQHIRIQRYMTLEYMGKRYKYFDNRKDKFLLPCFYTDDMICVNYKFYYTKK